MSRGSARGTPGRNLGAIFARHAELLVRFGGHEQAAGFTVENANLEEFIAALAAEFASLVDSASLESGKSRDISRDVDGYMSLASINEATLRSLAELEPFGQGFPEPVFMCRGVSIVRSRRTGLDGRNLTLTLRDTTGECLATWSKMGSQHLDVQVSMGSNTRFDAVFTLSSFRSNRDGRIVPVARLLALTPAR